MKCQICGQDIPDNSKFCAKCGARIPRCPTCGKVITKRIRFCANDGTPIPEDVLALIPAPLPAAAQADNQPVAAQDTIPSERTNPDRQTSDTQKANPSDSPAQSQEVQSGQAPDTNFYSEAAPPDKKKKGKARIVVIVCIIILLLAGGATCAYALFHGGGIGALTQTQDSSATVESTVQDRTDSDETESSASDADTELAVGGDLSPESEAEAESDSSAESEAASESEVPAESVVTEEVTDTEDADTTPITDSYADDRSYYGNSFENLSQGGILVASGEWIYYVSQSNNFTIWKMRADGTDQTLVSSTSARHISMLDDYLYYRAIETGYLHRLNVETGDDTVLVARDIYEPKVVGTYIYYEDQSDDSYDLYRCELDGSNEVKITDGVVFYCCVSDTRIYYLDTRDGRKGYSVALDGSDKQLWFDGRVGSIDYVDGTTYFTDLDNGGLYKMKDGEETYEQISSMTMKAINIYDGWIYFSDADNGGALTKVNLSDTSEVVILSTASCELINVCGGWVQYHAPGEDDDEGYYWVPTSGGAVVQF